MPDSVTTIAKAICKSGRFETGEGTCSLICMDQLGNARRNCSHVLAVHGKLAAQINDALDANYNPVGPTGPTGPAYYPPLPPADYQSSYYESLRADATERWAGDEDYAYYGLTTQQRWLAVLGTVFGLLALFFLAKMFLGA